MLCVSAPVHQRLLFREAIVSVPGRYWRRGGLCFTVRCSVEKRVVLVRHGESTWNEEGRIQGSSDFSVLTRKGESQAETSRRMLADDAFDACFASPLARSKRTAEIIWDSREADVITDLDLREIDLYSFQGLLKHEGKAKFGAAYHQWQTDAPNFNIDGHYPVRELWDRARSVWSKILAHESKSVLVVAHNAVNQALIATALGLGTEYFRLLLQSNCGVSVLDFTPRADGGSSHVCLNRLNQTPSSPVAGGSSAGRKASKSIVLVCHGSTQSKSEAGSPETSDGSMNMLGIIQTQKTAELLLDLEVNSIVTGPSSACVDTTTFIAKVQEAADCLGIGPGPRHVEMKQLQDLDAESILEQSNKAWRFLLDELSDESNPEKLVAVVASPAVNVALIGQCLDLANERLGSFHLDAGSVSVVDFPDGASGRGVVRCINYTAHLGRWAIPITRSKEF